MLGISNLAGIGGLCCNLYGQHIVGAVDNGLTAGIAQFQHLVNQTGNTVGILYNLLVDIGAGSLVELHIRHGDNLCKTTQDIQWRTYLVRNLTDKVGLHLRRLLGTLVGYHQIIIANF